MLLWSPYRKGINVGCKKKLAHFQYVYKYQQSEAAKDWLPSVGVVYKILLLLLLDHGSIESFQPGGWAIVEDFSILLRAIYLLLPLG